MRGSNGKSGLGSRPTSAASRIDEQGAEERQRLGAASRRIRGPPRSGFAPPRRARTRPRAPPGTSRERASRAIVQPGIRLPATPMYPLGPCSTAPGDESRARIRDSAARPKRSKRVAVEGLGRVAAGFDRQLAVGRQPHARAGRASISGPWSPSPAGSASRKRSSSGPSSPAGVASSFETVESAVSASWLAVLCGPVDQGITSGGGGVRESRLAQHDRGIQQGGVAVVVDEALRAESADARPVGGDEDQRLVVGGPREGSPRSPGERPSRAALVVAPLPRATSRGAISAIWSVRLAGQRRDQVAQVHVMAAERCRRRSARRPPRRRSRRNGSSPGRRASGPPPSPGSDREPTWRAPWRAGAALAGSKASGGIPADSLRGTSWSENIAITATRGTASSAYL